MYNVVHKMNNYLLGKGRERILECFYRNRAKEMYFSEILRATGLTQNTTLKHLKNLQNSNIILSTKKIGNTFYRINCKNPLVYSIFSYFDYKKFNGLPFGRRNAVSEFLGRLKTVPIIAVIFGSTAKGTFGKGSDIDILLVFNKKEAKDSKLREEIAAVTGFKIQALVIDFSYFREQLRGEEDKVVTHAIKTGFPVAGFDRFYKEVLDA
ncbi:MAG: nucleotidyltransferase domain-containing protein [archaeon]